MKTAPGWIKALGWTLLSVQGFHADVARASCNPMVPRESPDSDFTVIAGGHAVTHKTTGLIWRRCQLGMQWNGSTCAGIADALTWQEALLAVQNINNGSGIAGKHDWRLPNLNELLTLVDHGCHTPAINATMFPNTAYPTSTSDFYWSSTPNGRDGEAWLIRFQRGDILSMTMDHTLSVRPVRGTMVGTPQGSDGGSAQPEFIENFDSIDEVISHGWLAGNVSEPVGDYGWAYGDDTMFSAQAGASSSQMTAQYSATGTQGTISAWLLTPLLDFRADSMLTFWTRTATSAPFADRIQVRVCLGEPCNTIGPGAFGVDGYETLLLDINPNLQAGADASGANGYPDQWTPFTLDATDGMPTSGRGRIGFRYFVEDAGTTGINSYVVGLDSVRIKAASVN